MKSYILFLWRFIDPFYFHCTRLRYLDPEQNVLRVRLTRYKGKSVVLSDGSRINKNDLLIKIHLHNIRLLKEMQYIKSELKKTRHVYKKIEKSLPELATYIRAHQKSPEIKGIIGITALNRGSGRLGFEKADITNRLYKFFKQLALVPICYLSVEEPRKALKRHRPSYLFMSKNKLLERYARNP